MCLEVIGRATVAQRDYYVVKTTDKPVTNVTFHTQWQNTIYKRRMYSKTVKERGGELERSSFGDSVYHVWNPTFSKKIVKGTTSLSRSIASKIGVFRIPKGAVVYKGTNDEWGVTDIEYIGNTQQAKGYVLQQER